VRPGFGYYQDDDGMNAVATSYTRIPQTRGTVAFGLQMLSHCMKRKNGEMSVLAVCAHEFGHIKQFFEGYAEAIEQTMPGYCIELHADYMAGYYMSRHRDTYPTANLQVVGRLWSELGGGDYNRPGSHGTGAMRIDAIESGYKYAERYGKATSDDAARNGVAHVRKYARSS
jgi:hypothetical protein